MAQAAPVSRKPEAFAKVWCPGFLGQELGLAARCSGSAIHLAVIRRRFRLAPKPSVCETLLMKGNSQNSAPPVSPGGAVLLVLTYLL